MKTGCRNHQVVASHEAIELGDRLRYLGANATVGFLRQRDLGDYAFGRQMFEEGLTAFQPNKMCAQSRHDPRSALGDVAAQLRPYGSRARGTHHVTRCPGFAAVVVRIWWKRLSLAGQSRELAR